MSSPSAPKALFDPPLPYCQPERSLSFVPARELISTFVAPVPALHPASRPLPWVSGDEEDFFSPSALGSRQAFERSAALDFYDVARIFRLWFSDQLEHTLLFGNATTVARILDVIAALTVWGRCRGDLYMDFAKSLYCRLAIAPGGNLATLVWLVWRYVHGYAVALDQLCVELDDERDLGAACRLAFAFVTAGPTIPAHDPVLSADRAASDDAVFLWRGESLRLDRLVRKRLRLLARGVDFGLGSPRPGPGQFPFSYGPSQEFSSDVNDDSLQAMEDFHSALFRDFRDYAVYSQAASLVLVSVVDLLRVVGHMTALARRFLCPYEPRIGLAEGPGPVQNLTSLRKFFARLRSPLRQLRQTPATLLDGHFIEASRNVAVTPSFWGLAEGDMLQLINHGAALGVTAAWGVLPGEPDSFQRVAGRCIPTHCGVIFPTEYYGAECPRPDDDPEERPGERSFSRLHREAQEARRRSPPPVGPGERPRDAFEWGDLHHDDLEASAS